MASFKAPSFQDRMTLASNAKQKALDQLKAKPPVDPVVMAKRRQEAEARTEALAEERAVKAAARAEKASIKAAEIATAEAAAALKAARLKPSSPEEMKAARDARYAARKARR